LDDADDTSVVYHSAYWKPTPGNMALIAAAPDLLAALIAVREWRGLDGDGISDPVRSTVLAAIARAEGRR
jgi:hypothetical protein